MFLLLSLAFQRVVWWVTCTRRKQDASSNNIHLKATCPSVNAIMAKNERQNCTTEPFGRVSNSLPQYGKWSIPKILLKDTWQAIKWSRVHRVALIRWNYFIKKTFIATHSHRMRLTLAVIFAVIGFTGCSSASHPSNHQVRMIRGDLAVASCFSCSMFLHVSRGWLCSLARPHKTIMWDRLRWGNCSHDETVMMKISGKELMLFDNCRSGEIHLQESDSSALRTRAYLW